MSSATQEHLQRLEFIVANATNMVVVTNRKREIEWVNPAYTHITGWTLEEVKGKNPKTFLQGPGTSKSVATMLGTLLGRGRRVTDFELLNYKKSGEPYWVSLNIQPVIDEAGQITHFVAIQSDITDRKKAELEAATLTRQLVEAQRLARVGSVEHDIQTGEVRCSEQVFEILDARHGDGHGDCSIEKLLACVHPDDAAEVVQRYQQSLDLGLDFESEHRMLSMAGKLRWVHTRSATEKNEAGQVATRRLVLQDITERKRHELLQRDKDLLQHTVRAQTEVMSRVSHELRTPLHAILGFSEMLEKASGSALAPESRSCLGHIRDSAQHLLSMVGDILELTRVSSGAMPFVITPVDAHALVWEVAAMLETLAAGRNVRINVGLPAAISHVLADRQRLRQVLINLMGNAVSYNRPHGRVDVRFSVVDGSDMAMAVSDTGLGIAQADLDRLFEPFAQAVAVGAPLQGSGLGLSIARSLARGMGGDVVAASALGVGSTFVVFLPAAAPESAGELAATAEVDLPPVLADRAESVVGKVLYIEDNELNRMLVGHYLRSRPGVVLTTCASGSEGLAAARRIKPDLMVVDMQFPDMSGMDVLRLVQSDPQLSATPCVAFSANAVEADIDAALQAGFGAYLVKPASHRDFLDLIDRFLPRSDRA